MRSLSWSSLYHLLLILTTATLSLSSPQPKSLQNKRTIIEKDGITYTNFEHPATRSNIDYVTNSGICETTPGVNTYSGYMNVGQNMSMFFWFFEARNNASGAPIAMWLNGGPGCSGMIGVFQENGPCHFDNTSDKEPVLNPYSWNEYANTLYVDQPIGAGFSYGTDEATSTVKAAPFVWNFLQAFYDAFPQYKSRDFGLYTESFGGHYGPEFASYIEAQNAAIASNKITGTPINLIAVGINSGWYDTKIQMKAYIDFSLNNEWRPLITQKQADSLTKAFNTDCAPKLDKCVGLEGNDAVCKAADDACNDAVMNPITEAADFNVYDVRAPSNDPNPPETYMAYLNRKDIMKKIGARVKYTECADAPYDKIMNTGDDAKSFLPTLSNLVQSYPDLNVLLWAGDTDWICNWYGGLEVAEALNHTAAAKFKAKDVANYTVEGKSVGTFKNEGNLSWMRVFAAGHELAYYQPQTALQVMKQMMSKQIVSST